MAAQFCDYIKSHRIIRFKMVKMVSFMWCVSYHNKKKKNVCCAVGLPRFNPSSLLEGSVALGNLFKLSALQFPYLWADDNSTSLRGLLWDCMRYARSVLGKYQLLLLKYVQILFKIHLCGYYEIVLRSKNTGNFSFFSVHFSVFQIFSEKVWLLYTEINKRIFLNSKNWISIKNDGLLFSLTGNAIMW